MLPPDRQPGSPAPAQEPRGETVEEALEKVRDSLWRQASDAYGRYLTGNGAAGIRSCFWCRGVLEVLGERLNAVMKALPEEVLNQPVEAKVTESEGDKENGTTEGAQGDTEEGTDQAEEESAEECGSEEAGARR